MGSNKYGGSRECEIGDIILYITVSIDPIRSADNTYAFHSHIVPELIAIDGGNAEVEFSNGTSFKIMPGQVCYIPARTMHRTKATDENSSKMSIRYSYGAALESPHLYRRFDSAVQETVFPLVAEESFELYNVLCWMCRNASDRSYLSAVAFKAQYQMLGVGIIRLLGIQQHCGGAALNTSNQTKLTRKSEIEGWLDHWYSHDVSEAWVASFMGLSTRQINRMFHECFNMSFRDKLTEVRLNHAVDYLTATDMRVEDIAYKVGYTTTAGFQNAFRRKYGISPGKYRRENSKKKHCIP